MIDLWAAVPVHAILPLALLAVPYLAVRNLLPHAPLPLTLALTGAAAVTLNTAVPVFMHAAGIPITAGHFALAHGGATVLLLAAAWGRRLSPMPEATGPSDSVPWLPMVLLAILVLPFTHLAGIDTYKWQDLASNVQITGRIPWLIHPLSLFGFTPRAYPSAQPLVLGTIEILGGLGVDWGYYVFSLLSGLTGILAAYALGLQVFEEPRRARWFAFLYAFSPVFIRYNHWATGRGLFVALLPLFLLALVQIPRTAAWLGAAASAVLLALSHKTGAVAVPLILAAAVISRLLPRRDSRVAAALLAVPFVAAAVILSPRVLAAPPTGALAGFARNAVVRFAPLVPLAALGLMAQPGWFSKASWRRLFPAALLTFPLAFAADAYGALLALPFVTVAATAGLFWLVERYPRRSRAILLAVTLLTAAGALAVVVHRSRSATPRNVWAAAQFLEAFDPQGPFVVHAPGTARNQIQGYVAGCPRFDVVASPDARLRIPPTPPLRGDPRSVFRAWVGYARGFLSLSDVDTDWYGKEPREYYVVISGRGDRPPDSRRLYQRDGVEIYEAAGQRR